MDTGKSDAQNFLPRRIEISYRIEMAAMAEWPRAAMDNAYQAKAGGVNELLLCSKIH
ncbi:hypothetical protein [Rhizobium sp. BR 315]|uniref:hypothetical protein n=1 Tax=Rhizobium sp. BR 315 TaxID=3040014 RepID=UPI003D3299E2